MSVFPAKRFILALFLTLLSGWAMAESGPQLALPPTADDQAPLVISAPSNDASGFAAMPPPAPVIAATPTAPAPSLNPTPVEATPLTEVKPDSIGLMSNTNGGLGASLWTGTSRAFAERFLPMLATPSSYASLNDLAARFLLTTAGSPEGAALTEGGQTLTAMRVNKLIALGRGAEAWKFAMLAGADQLDELTLLQVAEVGLLGSTAPDVCARLPEITRKFTSTEWQKLTLVCQLQAKDTKAAQLSLDVMHSQPIDDASFIAVAERNIIGGSAQLPRQLTPMKPLTLALIRLTDLPLRGEVYAHPDAALIPELLKAKTLDVNAEAMLAERAAAKGIIGTVALADVYRGQGFSPENLSSANISGEHGPLLRALLVQAAQKETNSVNRMNEAIKFAGSFDSGGLEGNILPLAGEILGDLAPSQDNSAHAATIAHLYTLAGKTADAAAWIEFARNTGVNTPDVAAEFHGFWPLMVLSGLEDNKDYNADLDAWLTVALPAAGQQDADSARAKKITTSSLLLLLDAAGFPVSDEAWIRVADTAAYEKSAMPPAFLLQRLRAAAVANHKGAAILLTLLVEPDGKDSPPLLATLESVHALRAIGLGHDANGLARDSAIRIMGTPAKP